jgi:hypothetical protein
MHPAVFVVGAVTYDATTGGIHGLPSTGRAPATNRKAEGEAAGDLVRDAAVVM